MRNQTMTVQKSTISKNIFNHQISARSTPRKYLVHSDINFKILSDYLVFYDNNELKLIEFMKYGHKYLIKRLSIEQVNSYIDYLSYA